MDQKGYDNRKEVTLDVRTKEVREKGTDSGDQEILNYIISRYKALSDRQDIDAKQRDELIEIGERYQRALRDKEDDGIIDDLEGELIEKIEDIEEDLEDIE